MIILGRFFKELVCVLYVTRKLKFIRAFLNGEEVTKIKGIIQTSLLIANI